MTEYVYERNWSTHTPGLGGQYWNNTVQFNVGMFTDDVSSGEAPFPFPADQRVTALYAFCGVGCAFPYDPPGSGPVRTVTCSISKPGGTFGSAVYTVPDDPSDGIRIFSVAATGLTDAQGDSFGDELYNGNVKMLLSCPAGAGDGVNAVIYTPYTLVVEYGPRAAAGATKWAVGFVN